MRLSLIMMMFLASQSMAGEVGQDGTRTEKFDGIVQPLRWETPQNTVMNVYCGWPFSGDLFITCKHNVDQSIGDTIRHPDGRTLKLVYVTEDSDGLAVWKSSVPYKTSLLVSDSPIQVGDTVYHIGMPEGKPVHYTSGKVTSLPDGMSSFAMSNSNYAQGYSGGPVVNADGKVVGINIATDDTGNREFCLFSPITSLKTVMTQYSEINPLSGRPFVDVLVSKDFECSTCKQFIAYARETGAASRGFDYRVRGVSSDQMIEMGISVPSFFIGKEMYQGPMDFRLVDEWATRKLGQNNPQATAEKADSNKPQSHPAGPEKYARDAGNALSVLPPGVTASPEAIAIMAQALSPPEKVREPDPVVDWGMIEIIVAVSDKIPEIAKAASGPGRRAVQRITGGKASLLIISERDRPSKYNEYQESLGITIDLFHVSVLVPETSIDLPIEFIVTRLESIINANVSSYSEEKIRDIPVEPIFQSLSRKDYESIKDIADDPGEVEAENILETVGVKDFGIVAALMLAAYRFIPFRKLLNGRKKADDIS